MLPLPVSPNDLKVRLVELAKLKEQRSEPIAHLRPGDGILDPLTNFYTFAHFKEVLFVEVKRAPALRLSRWRWRWWASTRSPGQVDDELRAQLMGGLALAIRRSLRDTDYPVQQATDRVLLADAAHRPGRRADRRTPHRASGWPKATLQRGDEMLQPTISVGVAAGAPGREYAFSDLVRQAQEGLAAAQARGGNRVEFSTTRRR